MHNFPIFLCVHMFQNPHLCSTEIPQNSIFLSALPNVSSYSDSYFSHFLPYANSCIGSTMIRCFPAILSLQIHYYYRQRNKTTQKLSLPFGGIMYPKRKKKKKRFLAQWSLPREPHSFADIAASLKAYPNSPGSPQQKKNSNLWALSLTFVFLNLEPNFRLNKFLLI